MRIREMFYVLFPKGRMRMTVAIDVALPGLFKWLVKLGTPVWFGGSVHHMQHVCLPFT